MNLRIRDEQRSIKIAVMEVYSNKKENAIKPIKFEKIYPQSHHAEMVVELIRMSVPNAEIYLLPANRKGMEWILKNDIPLVSLSASSTEDPFFERELAKKSFLFTSAGNSGKKGESFSARQEHWCAVGAIDKATLKVTDYSSYGTGAVKTCAFTEFKIPNTNIRSKGTSGACPFLVGQVAQWYIWFHGVFGVYPSVESTYDFIQANSHDIWDDENPLKYGWGLFRLPYEFTAKQVEIDTNKKLRYARLYKYRENSPRKIKEVDLMGIPFINEEEGRTYVPSNGLTTQFGITVYWDEDEFKSKYVK